MGHPVYFPIEKVKKFKIWWIWQPESLGLVVWLVLLVWGFANIMIIIDSLIDNFLKIPFYLMSCYETHVSFENFWTGDLTNIDIENVG